MKTPLLAALVAGLGISILSTHMAQAAFVMTGGSDTIFPISGNNYNSNLQALGFTSMRESAQLSVDMNGFVDLYFIGAESGYSNTFTVTDHSTLTTSSITEPVGNDNVTSPMTPFDFGGVAGYQVITFAVTAGEILDFQFSNDTNSNTVDNFAGTRLFDLGIVYDSSIGNGSLDQVVLAYDDAFSKWARWGIDDNHDDMLIRADFRPIPVPPALWLFGSGLLGLVGMARRKKAA